MLAASLSVIGRALNASSQIAWISGVYFVYVHSVGSSSYVVLLRSTDSIMKHFHRVSASLRSPVEYLVSQDGPPGRFGHLLRGFTSSLAGADSSPIDRLPCHHRGGRRGAHDDRPDDCE